ncbi:Hpt domain-containing protein [Paenarthrobacter sp. S56]|uniref:Hpt domain-containing protein n=1 Tax=Paenarthrobacter sp. S56 TaxID=3138179 RepID=UPI00321A6320
MNEYGDRMVQAPQVPVCQAASAGAPAETEIFRAASVQAAPLQAPAVEAASAQAANTGGTTPLPAFEDRTLKALADELGDSQPVLRLLSTYLSMLPGRIGRIASGLCQNDPDASMEAVLSLKISSAMIGAHETEQQCRAMEYMIREDHLDYAVKALPALRQYTDRCFNARPQLLGRARKTLGCP